MRAGGGGCQERAELNTNNARRDSYFTSPAACYLQELTSAVFFCNFRCRVSSRPSVPEAGTLECPEMP